MATRVGHTLAAIRAAARRQGASCPEAGPGLLDIRTDDVAALVSAVCAGLSAVEALEVRAVVVTGEVGNALVAAALVAPSLAQLGARVEHADLLPLFENEHASFRSVYQPIVALEDDPTLAVGEPGGPTTVAFEALLRATGSAGTIMPDQLFAAAHQAGWLHVLDRIGRTTAVRGAGGWLGERQLFVNFLPTTIYRPEICLATTERAVDAAGLRLDQLVFEVTESEKITDLAHLSRVFDYYRQRGCKVALDDLGAGYSSLNALVTMQPDVVKLDKEIVQKLPDPISRTVITAVVEITHGYGGLVLAECVETAEQARIAHDLGVDLGQGWYFGRPTEAPDLTTRSQRADDAAPVDSTRARTTRALGTDGNDPAVQVTPTDHHDGPPPPSHAVIPRQSRTASAVAGTHDSS